MEFHAEGAKTLFYHEVTEAHEGRAGALGDAGSLEGHWGRATSSPR